MRIGVAQSRPGKGDVDGNIAGHLRLLELADGADAVIFPELSITGYEPELAEELATTPEDSRFAVLQRCADARRMTIGVGVPLRFAGGISISMVLFQPDAAPLVYSKKYIHADEEPFFVSRDGMYGLQIGGENLALAICYELSVPEHAARTKEIGADFYIASAVKTVAQVDRAWERLAEIARTYGVTVFFSNCIGRSGGEECGGRSAVWNDRGERLGALDDNREGILIFDSDTGEVIVRYAGQTATQAYQLV